MTLGERLKFLFDYIYPAGEGPYTYVEVAERASTEDVPITEGQIRSIISHRVQRPSFATISALADFFNVPLDYFATTDEAALENYTDWITSLRSRVDTSELYAARTNRWQEKRKQRRKRSK